MLVGTLIAAGLLAGCAPSQQEVDYQARKALLERQTRGMRELIAEAVSGKLLPTGRFLVGIDEEVVADVLRSQLPLENPLGKQLMVRLERATVLFRDKYGSIIIEGEVHRRATPDRRTAVRIYSGLGAVAIDPQTDLLNVDIAIDRIELLEAGILDGILGAGGKKLLSERGRPLIQDALPTLKIPVALAQTIRIPAIQGGAIQLDSLTVPLNLSVEAVFAARQKLWLRIDAEVGKVTGGEEGLGVAVRKKPRKPGGAR